MEIADWRSVERQGSRSIPNPVAHAMKPHLVNLILPKASSRAASRLTGRFISRVNFHTVLTTLGYATTAESDELFDEWSSTPHAAVDWEEVRLRLVDLCAPQRDKELLPRPGDEVIDEKVERARSEAAEFRSLRMGGQATEAGAAHGASESEMRRIAAMLARVEQMARELDQVHAAQKVAQVRTAAAEARAASVAARDSDAIGEMACAGHFSLPKCKSVPRTSFV